MAKQTIQESQKIIRETKPLLTTDWTSEAGSTPFFEKSPGRYAVSVSLSYETVGRNFQRAMREGEYLRAGVNKILNYYNKDTSDLDYEDIGEVIDKYVPERPRAKVRVLVVIPVNKFDILPENSVVSVDLSEEISLNTYGLRDNLNGIGHILRKYEKEIKEFDGNVYGINLDDEAESLDDFIAAISNLMQKNGFVFNDARSDLISLGVDSTYNVQYVQYNQGNGFVELNNNFGEFKNFKALKNPQTIFYLSKIEDIYGDSKSVPSMNWQEFLKKYTKKKFRIANNDQRRASPEKENWFEREKKSMDRNSIKTARELANENLLVGENPFVRSTMAKAQKQARDNVSTHLLGNIDKAQTSLAQLETAYANILHKYQLAPIIQQAIFCIDPHGEIARRYAQVKEFMREANNFIADIVKVLEIPVISLDDLIPTIDMMKDIGKKLLWSILEAVTTALLKMLQDLLMMLLQSCPGFDLNEMSFGGMNLKTLLNDPTAMLEGLGSGALKATMAGLEQGFSAAPSEGVSAFGAQIIPGGQGALALEQSKTWIKNIQGFFGDDGVQILMRDGVFSPGGPMSQLFDDVSAVLTPAETVRLLKGEFTPSNQGSDKILRMLRDLIQEKPNYPDSFKEFFSSEEKINDAFKSMGNMVNEDVLMDHVAAASDMLGAGQVGLCDSTDEALRRQLLEQKGLSPEEISQQLSRSAERKKKRLEELSNMLEGSDWLQNSLPPVYCSIDANGNLIEGMTDVDHSSFTFLLNRTIDTTYDGVYSMFNDEIENYVPSLKTRTQTLPGREIKRIVRKDQRASVHDVPQNKESWYMINPEFRMYLGQGYTPHIPFPTPIPTPDEGEPLISPNPEVEFKVWQDHGELSSIFVPEIGEKIDPGLKEEISKISSIIPSEANYRFKEKELKLTIPNQVISQFNANYGGVNAIPNAPATVDFRTYMRQKVNKNINFGPDNFALDYLFDFNPTANYGGRDPSIENFYLGIKTEGGGSANKRLFGIEVTQNINAAAWRSSTKIMSYYSPRQKPSFPQQEVKFVNWLLDVWDKGQFTRKISSECYPTSSLQAAPRTVDPITAGTIMGNYGFEGDDLTADRYGGDADTTTMTEELEAIALHSQAACKEINKEPPTRRDGPGAIQVGSGLAASLFEDQQPRNQNIGSLYKEVYKDFITAFSSEIARSDLFDDGVIDLVNFSPRLSLKEKASGCKDQGLLDLDTIKQIIQREYDSAKCLEKNMPSPDGTTDTRNNPLESAMTSGAVRVIIRTYAIEMILQSIFAFGEFKFTRPEDVDVSLLVFLRRTIIVDLQIKGYLNEFMDVALKTYKKYRKLQANPSLVNTNNPATALSYLIKIEFWETSEKISKFLGVKEKDTIDATIIDALIPVYDVAVNPIEIESALNYAIRGVDPRDCPEDPHPWSAFAPGILNERLTSDSKRTLAKAERELSRLGLDSETLERKKRLYTHQPVIGSSLSVNPFAEAPTAQPGTSYVDVIDEVARTVAGMVAAGPDMLGFTFRELPFMYNVPAFTSYGVTGFLGQSTGDLTLPESWLEDITMSMPGFVETTSNYYEQIPGIVADASVALFSKAWQETAGLFGFDVSGFGGSFHGFEEGGLPPGVPNRTIRVGEDYDGNPIYRAEIPPGFGGPRGGPSVLENNPIPEDWADLDFSDNIWWEHAPRGNYLKFFGPLLQMTKIPDEAASQMLENLSEDPTRAGTQFLQNFGEAGGSGILEKYSFSRDSTISQYVKFPSEGCDVPPKTSWAFPDVAWKPLKPDPLRIDDLDEWTGEKGDQNGLKDRRLWKKISTSNELKGVMTMWEIFNNPHPLMPGNAGKSFSEMYADRRVSHFSTQITGGGSYSDPQYMHKLVELPWTRPSTDPNKPYQNPWTIDKMPALTYARKSNQENFDDMAWNEISEEMYESYNLQNATIQHLPEDIQKEIDYYQSWFHTRDRSQPRGEDLYFSIRRQFEHNRMAFNLTRNEKIKLDKVGEELINNRWHGRKIPTVAQFDEMMDRVYRPTLDRKGVSAQAKLQTFWGQKTFYYLLHQVKARLKNFQDSEYFDIRPCEYWTFKRGRGVLGQTSFVKAFSRDEIIVTESHYHNLPSAAAERAAADAASTSFLGVGETTGVLEWCTPEGVNLGPVAARGSGFRGDIPGEPRFYDDSKNDFGWNHYTDDHILPRFFETVVLEAGEDVTEANENDIIEIEENDLEERQRQHDEGTRPFPYSALNPGSPWYVAAHRFQDCPGLSRHDDWGSTTLTETKAQPHGILNFDQISRPWNSVDADLTGVATPDDVVEGGIHPQQIPTTDAEQQAMADAGEPIQLWKTVAVDWKSHQEWSRRTDFQDDPIFINPLTPAVNPFWAAPHDILWTESDNEPLIMVPFKDLFALSREHRKINPVTGEIQYQPHTIAFTPDPDWTFGEWMTVAFWTDTTAEQLKEENAEAIKREIDALYWMYQKLFEFDFFMSKLMAFTLLSPDFEDVRPTGDYIEFLRDIKSQAVQVRDHFEKDVISRTANRNNYIKEVGGIWDSHTLKGYPLTLESTNGNIVFEKYIKLKERDWGLAFLDIHHANPASRDAILNALRSIVENRPDHLKGIVNLKAFQEWLNHNFGENGVWIEQGGEGLAQAMQQASVFTPGAISEKSVREEDECGTSLHGHVRGEPDYLPPVPPGIRLRDLFDEVSLGFRATVVSAPDSNIVKQIEQRTGDSGLWDRVQSEKAYYLREALLQNTNVVGETAFVTFPLIGVEEELDLMLLVETLTGQRCIPNLDAEEDSCFDIAQNDTLCIWQGGTIEYLYRKSLKKFRASIKETDEFKLLFKYLFNADRMFALNALYILTYVQSMQSSTRLFGGTKELLRLIFMALIHSGDYTYKDPMTNKNLANADFKNPGKDSEVGFDLATLAYKFPLMVLKGVTELIDPNIAVAKIITKASNAAAQGVTDWAQEQGLTPKERCEAGYDVPDIPILPVSLGLLPMNIFPPPPFGPGIGPPVSPLWPFYMAFFNGIGPDPLADYSSKQRSRLANRCESDRDLTKISECKLDNTEEE